MPAVRYATKVTYSMKFYTHNSSRQRRTSGASGVLSLVTLVHEVAAGELLFTPATEREYNGK